MFNIAHYFSYTLLHVVVPQIPAVLTASEARLVLLCTLQQEFSVISSNEHIKCFLCYCGLWQL